MNSSLSFYTQKKNNHTLHIVTVSTDDRFYFKYLIESCKKNGVPLTVLGYGEKWKGYTWRFKLMMDFIKSVDPYDVICFVDSYDVLCIRNLDTLLNTFLKIKEKYNCKIITGYEHYNSFIQKTFADIYFSECNGKHLNCGTYIGHAKDLLHVLITSKSIDEKETDDQKLLTKYCQIYPNDIYIDIHNEIFLVIHNSLNEIYNELEIDNNNNISYNKNHPYFIHGASSSYLNKLIKRGGYQIDNQTIKKINEESIQYVLKKTMEHGILFFKTYFIFITLITMILLFFMKQYAFIFVFLFIMFILFKVIKAKIQNIYIK
jgi:hypothetical protein